MRNLVEELLAAVVANREHLQQLEETAQLLHGDAAAIDSDPGLRLAATVTRHLIETTEAAIASGDVVRMVEAAHLNGLEAT